jgi:hypothetical protein
MAEWKGRLKTEPQSEDSAAPEKAVDGTADPGSRKVADHSETREMNTEKLRKPSSVGESGHSTSKVILPLKTSPFLGTTRAMS